MNAGLWRWVLAAALLLGAGGVQAQDHAFADPESVLGGLAGDYVYTPVVPCRIVDTRQAGGSLAPGTVRDFKVTGSGLQGQGGNPLGCGVPAGPARSAIINFVAVNPTGVGNLRAWAYSEPGLPAPTASIINYTTGISVANGIAVPLCDPAPTTCTFDLKIQADGNGAHLVADVVGYFGAPVSLTIPWTAVTGKPAGFADNVDNDTTYSSGFGLQLVGTQFSALPTVLQRRLTTSCAAGSSIRSIDEGGVPLCETDDVGTGDITEVATATNSGLTGGVTAGVANLAVDPSDFNGSAPIAESHTSVEVSVPVGATSTLRSVSITVPAGATSGGHIAVIGMTNVNCSSAHCPAPFSVTNGQLGWDSVSDGPGQNQKPWTAGATGGTSVVAIDQFTVSVPGTYTYYLRGNCIGPGNCDYDNISALAFFIPR